MKIKKEKTEKRKIKHVKNEIEIKEKCNMKEIDSIVFDSFKKLTSDIEKDRVYAGVQLLQHLTRQNENEKESKEMEYALKRLIRGVGASTTQSRAGFFTTLVGFLQMTPAANDFKSITKVLEIAKKELKVGAIIGNKEDSDAIVGQILTCGALLRANIEINNEDIKNVVQLLLETSNYRTYHKALAYSFIVEILQKVTEEQFTESVWPLLEPYLNKPWPNQNINTLHCLLVAQQKFPTILTHKYFKRNFHSSELLNPESYKNILKIYWHNTNVSVVAQPGVEYFATYIANSKNLIEFWTIHLNQFLGSKNVTKIDEIQTLKILTDILLNTNPNKIHISELFTENLIKMITSSLKTIKPKKDITLKAFYDDLFDALLQCCNKITDDKSSDDEKVELIRKLILPPGILNIEKFTTNRIIHQIIGSLKETGVQKLFIIYKNIFLNKLEKNPINKNDQWLNIERQNAGYMLQTLISHKSVQMLYEWRLEQLKFFMILGLFNTNENFDIIKQNDNDDDNDNDNDWLGNDFTEQMKNIFYTSLQTKMNKLNDEKLILLNLVEYCNEILHKKHFNKYLKNKINEKILKAWQEMYNEISIKTNKQKSLNNNKNDKLQLVFHILLLHMGLQLFREPEMAETAILDLEKCMKNIKQKTNNNKKKSRNDLTENNNNNDNNEQPDWIEVVVDLFLHLLSQNTSALRNIVNFVFPHLCDSLTLTAVHQILSVLEMKDGYNPLSENNQNNEEINQNDNNSSSDESDESSNENSENDEKDSDNDVDEESSDDDEDEEIMDEEEEESANETDKLRNAISIALSTIGNNKDTDDLESLDLDDLNEEDGEKLDNALSEAFKAMRKTSDSNNKRTKGYRIQTTTIIHFRIRVLDLIEIYIQNNPNLLITIEILINLFNMIEFCTADDNFQTLHIKIDKILNKLTNLRQFSNTDDVNEKNICDYLRLIIEKKIRSTSFDAYNKIRSKCCHFLILNSKFVTENNQLTEISKILDEYLIDFIKSRNPIINITLLTDIFQMRWQYVWQLAIKLAENGLTESTRTYRRIQIIELLENLYKNHKLIDENMKLSKKSMKLIENNLIKHIKHLNITNKQISNREFITILLLLITINRCHNKIQLELNFNCSEVCNVIQEIRKKIKLDTTQNYIKFCNIFKLQIIKNADVIIPNITTVLENGTCQIEILEEDETSMINENDGKKIKGNKLKKKKIVNENSEKLNGSAKKRKNPNKNDLRKEKKMKKEERMKVSSKGLNGGLNFSDAPVDVIISDLSENDDNNEPESSDDSD